MNEDFLISLQKEPQQEFTARLYRKITQPAEPSSSIASVKWLGLPFAILITALALAFVFVPSVRADVEFLIRKIAGVSFEELSQSPITCDPMKCDPGEELLWTMSVEEAQATVPFAIHLPDWTPDGYWLNPRVRLIRSSIGYDLIEVEWLRTGLTQENHWDYTQQMTLRIWQDQLENPTWMVGQGSISEITVNRQPAALIHGGWELFNKDWNGNGMTQITWERDGIRYVISAVFVEPAAVISDEDLIRMAESIP